VTSHPPAIEALGICRRYGRRWALADVTVSVPRGSALMVTGRNGSGKSTLLRILATAIRPHRGTARVEGLDLRGQTRDVRRRVALLSHHHYLYDSLTALENLQIAARFLNRDPSRKALLPLLAEVGLADRADDAPVGFSAGMRKRLALARVLLPPASVVLLDEPYGQLDPPGFRLVDRLVARWREQGATVLMATHLLERGGDLCDGAIVLDEGRLTWEGPAREVAAQSGLAAPVLVEGGA